MRYIIDTYTLEGGVRKLKEKIFEIFREINLRKLMGLKINNKNISYPINITQNIVEEILKIHHKIIGEKIHFEPQIGKINGLYATENDIGGIIPIEINFLPADKKLVLPLPIGP